MEILENKRKKSQDKIRIFEEEEKCEKVPSLRRQIMYVTQLNRLNKKYLNEDGTLNSNILEKVLRANLTPEDGYSWAYLVHDLDELKDGRVKPIHLHLIIYRQKGVQMNLLYEILEDSQKSNFEYGKSYKAFELYLIHDTEKAKSDAKHLYDEHTVVANYDYVAQIEKYRKHREKAKQGRESDDYINQILKGELTLSDFVDESRFELLQFYAKHRKKVDDALHARALLESKKEKCELLGEYEENRVVIEKDLKEKKIIWLYGESGTGKSVLSRLLAKAFSNNPNEIYFSSSKNDVFQNYTNERIVVLEELRPGAIMVEDMFRLFDKNINVSIKRRYRNVDVKADVIIINSILSPIQFYARKFDRLCDVTSIVDVSRAMHRADMNGEPAMQLFRRLTDIVEVTEKNGLAIHIELNEILNGVIEDSIFNKRIKTYECVPKKDMILEIDEKYKNLLRHKDGDLPF